MNTGILTYHRAYNYGAVLQCYALQEVLRGLGHEVSVIDYRQPDIERFYAYRRVKKRTLLSPLRDLKRLVIHAGYKSVFESFQQRRLRLTEAYTDRIPADFDRYVIGSDMLWAYDAESKAFEPFYFGEFSRRPDSRLVGYAISGTTDSFRRLGEERRFDFCANFDALSIREKSLAEIVGACTGKEPVCCLDPTLLTTKENWADFSSPRRQGRKYLVTYFLRVRGKDLTALREKVETLAREKGLETVNIDAMGSSLPMTVEDFVSVIRGAQYVVSDSFHGIVFSLIFERPFHALRLRDAHDARYVDILHALGADDLAVDLDYVPVIPEIDYAALNGRLRQLRAGSLAFLKENL